MTVETDIAAVLAAVCPRVTADFADVGTARPYVTFQQVGGMALNYIDTTAPDLKHGEYQINVWADSRLDATSTARAIEAAMRAATAFTARPLGDLVADFDADMKRHGTRQDFSVFSTR